MPTQTTAASGVFISVQNFAFHPAAVTVPRNTKVTWTNLDAADHQIINDATAQAAQGALFMSNPLPQGATYSFTFTTAGTYPYHCNIHPSMKGTITVT
ncbi:MAG: cupredoxin domain-containing protein [Methanoregulaceae archaeon]|nr:cupredoxin domain-containing protein [Methanoregulaceae archaeon]